MQVFPRNFSAADGWRSLNRGQRIFVPALLWCLALAGPCWTSRAWSGEAESQPGTLIQAPGLLKLLPAGEPSAESAQTEELPAPADADRSGLPATGPRNTVTVVREGDAELQPPAEQPPELPPADGAAGEDSADEAATEESAEDSDGADKSAGGKDEKSEKADKEAEQFYPPLQSVQFNGIQPRDKNVPVDIAAKRFAEEGQAVPAMDGMPCRPLTYAWVAPGLCYRPLYFEEPNLERHGYCCGLAQPFVSAAHFFGSVPLMPYKMVVECPHDCIYAYGHRRPGSCAPMEPHYLPFCCEAGLVEAAVIAGVIIVFP